MGIAARKARRRRRPLPAIPAGWNLGLRGLVNPRPPAVTRGLSGELTLGRYYAAAALMGILASQVDEPNKQWALGWALEIGEDMAKEAKKQDK